MSVIGPVFNLTGLNRSVPSRSFYQPGKQLRVLFRARFNPGMPDFQPVNNLVRVARGGESANHARCLRYPTRLQLELAWQSISHPNKSAVAIAIDVQASFAHWIY